MVKDDVHRPGAYSGTVTDSDARQNPAPEPRPDTDLVTDEEVRAELRLLRKDPWFTRPRALGWFLIVLSAIGFLASFELSIDKVELLKNSDAVLSCDFNPFFSCGDVMKYWQSEFFGFPNQFLGIAAFVVPLFMGVLLVSRAEIPRWIWVALNVGLFLGVVAVIALFITSIYVIGIGCPWCIVVWTVVIPMFWVVTSYNAVEGNLGRRIADNGGVFAFASHGLLIGIMCMIVIYALIVIRFWTFFGSLI